MSPKLLADPAASAGAVEKTSPRAVSTSYSWRRTEQFIDWERPRIEELEEKLRIMPKLAKSERHAVYTKIIVDYPELDSNQKTIDHHIQYNRFWQRAIEGDRPRFDRHTKLHDLVLERQNLADEIKKSPRPELIERERVYAQLIHAENSAIMPAPYIRVSHKKPKVWILHVPMYTDIQDAKWMQRFKRGIERAWSVEDGENVYRLLLEITVLAPQRLYPDSPPPVKGAHFEPGKHAARFPRNGGVLTTGSNSTYAIPTRFIALGPQDISMNVIAHEFGHILGFVDGYFRGYRDRGEEGFEVLEIVPDPDDIMCTPGAGHVRSHHFKMIIEKLEKLRTAPQPARQ